MPTAMTSAPPTPSRIPRGTSSRPASPTKQYSKPLAEPAPTRDVHMQTAKGWPGSPSKGVDEGLGEIRMETARAYPSAFAQAKAPPLKLWERELLETPEVKRKATVAQLCT